jgi:hypothetical protein
MLCISSHESWSDFFARCEVHWRNKESLTKEAAADSIVAIHNSSHGPEKTGQHFNPSSVTEANRLKANCMTLDRVKEKDLFNMLPYILAAMSPETKLAFAAQYLQPAGMTVHLSSEEEEDGYSLESAVNTQIAVNQACTSLLDAAMNPTPQNLDAAEREAVKVIKRFERTRAFLAGARKIGARLGNAMKRKEVA